MEIPILYGHPLSQPTRSVMVFLELNKIEYKLEEINFIAGENMKKPFRKLSPNQEIPVLVKGSFNIWESAAIIQYLSDLYNLESSYFPKNPETRARILSYLHWHHENVRRPIILHIRKTIIFPLLGKPQLSEIKEKKLKDKAANVLNTLEWVLQDTGYIARTDIITIADIFAFNEVVSGYMCGFNIYKFSRLKEWFFKVAQIPEVRKICDRYIEEFLQATDPPKI